ncbi:MAG: zinc ribbon domain-containing protein [Promethearchaeota archaeon]
MKLIREYKNYIWIIVLIGGVLTLVSFFTPAFYYDRYPLEEHYWMWGLYYSKSVEYGSDTLFIPMEEPTQYTIPIFLSGIIPAMMILIGALILIAIANSVRIGRKDIKNVENKVIGGGLYLITASVIYLIGIQVTMGNYIEYLWKMLTDEYDYYDIVIPDLWDIYEPGFAIIGPFIGAGLAITAGVASKVTQPPKEVIKIQERQDFIEKQPTTSISQPEPISNEILFCPECGKKRIYKESKFCSHCGFEFKS